MTEKRKRLLAHFAVRDELKRLGLIPHHVSGIDAYTVLDELAQRGIPNVSVWYKKAKEYSLDAWVREWNAWARAKRRETQA